MDALGRSHEIVEFDERESIPGFADVHASDAEIGLDDVEAMQAARLPLGSGMLMVIDQSRDIHDVLVRLSKFFAHESCGKCTPCREGTGWLWRMMTRLAEGRARIEEIDLLEEGTREIEGHTICALGDAAAWPVQSFLKHYHHEFEYMIRNQGRSIVDAAPGEAA